MFLITKLIFTLLWNINIQDLRKFISILHETTSIKKFFDFKGSFYINFRKKNKNKNKRPTHRRSLLLRLVWLEPHPRRSHPETAARWLQKSPHELRPIDAASRGRNRDLEIWNFGKKGCHFGRKRYHVWYNDRIFLIGILSFLVLLSFLGSYIKFYLLPHPLVSLFQSVRVWLVLPCILKIIIYESF